MAGQTPLMLACKAKDEEAVERILKELGDTVSDHINHQDMYGHTALYYAIGRRHERIAIRLIDHGADVTWMDSTGFTHLMWAIHFRLYVLAKRIIQEVSQDYLNTVRDNQGYTILFQAMMYIRYRRTDLLLSLIDHGADVKLVTRSGTTPLMQAATWGVDVVVLERIIEELGDTLPEHINRKSYGVRSTALINACYNGCETTAIRLIDYGADVKLANGKGTTPLMKAAWSGFYVVVERILKELGDTVFEHINLKDTDGYTALSYACFKKHVDIVRLLLEHGADPRISWKPDLMLDDDFQSFMKRTTECSREGHAPEIN